MTSAPAKEAGLLPCPCNRCANEAVAADGGGPFDPRLVQMFLCPTCGNKRCPHATDHRLACTGSNEPGQEGSSYGVPLRAPSPSPDQPAGEGALERVCPKVNDHLIRMASSGSCGSLEEWGDFVNAIRDLTARAEAAEGAVLDAAAAYLIETYGKSYGLNHPVDRRRILAALATEAKDGRAG